MAAVSQRRSGTRRSILVITDDVISATMAGPAIRAWNIATVLSAGHDVRLASTVKSEASSPHFAVCEGGKDFLRSLAAHQDIIVVQGFTLSRNPWLAEMGARLVVDLYDPIHLEILEMTREEPAPLRAAKLQDSIRALEIQVRTGDFFLAASERQRDLWIGHLAAWGRVNFGTYEQDPTLRSLIDIAPFGITAQPAHTDKPAIKGKIAGIEPDDKVLLWAGGVYNWFDPVTLIRAVAVIAATRPDVKLLFMGTKHPTMDDPTTAAIRDGIAEATRLDVLDTHVFFADGWVPYADRQDYLLDADLGVSTHFDHVETAFAFRTRMLDYLWAGLPIVCTEGDSFADLVTVHELGIAVAPRDEQALAQALLDLLGDPERGSAISARIAEFRSRFEWSSALEPLVRYCATAERAADAQSKDSGIGMATRWGTKVDAGTALIRGYVAANGWKRLVRRGSQLVLGRIRRAFGR